MNIEIRCPISKSTKGLVVFSHGAPVDPQIYCGLLESLSRQGFWVVCPHFKGPTELTHIPGAAQLRGQALNQALASIPVQFKREGMPESLQINQRDHAMVLIGHSFGCLGILEALNLEKKRLVRAQILINSPDPLRFGVRPESLKSGRIPTLFIHGAQDPQFNETPWSSRIAQWNPTLRQMVIDGMGHGSILDVWLGDLERRTFDFPDSGIRSQVVNSVKRFLKSLPP